MTSNEDWKDLSRIVQIAPGKPGEPDEEHAELQLHKSRTYFDLRFEIFELKWLFESSGIRLDASSDLRRHMTEALAFIDAWERGDPSEPNGLIGLLFVDTIVQAVLPLRDLPVEKRKRFLAPLVSGSLHPLLRAHSKAKDILWELALWNICLERGFKARLEEPDILLRLNSKDLGVSCKKVYSEKNFKKVLSVGVSQMVDAGVSGIIAVNIDDLLGEGQFVVAPDHQNFFSGVSNLNVDFIVKHQKLLERYLPSGRAIAVLVSCQAFGLVNEALNLTRQFAIWAHPRMPPEKLALLREFRDGLFGSNDEFDEVTENRK